MDGGEELIPGPEKDYLLRLYPGQLYDPDEQCKIAYGPTSYFVAVSGNLSGLYIHDILLSIVNISKLSTYSIDYIVRQKYKLSVFERLAQLSLVITRTVKLFPICIKLRATTKAMTCVRRSYVDKVQKVSVETSWPWMEPPVLMGHGVARENV